MTTQLIFENFPGPRKIHPKEAKFERPKTDRQIKDEIFANLEQMVSFKPGYFTIYNDTTEIRKLGHIAKQNVQRSSIKGHLSRQAGSLMMAVMGYLCEISQNRKYYDVDLWYDDKGRKRGGYRDFCLQTFITLTMADDCLPGHDDFFIKQVLLKNFVDAIHKRLPGLSYVWKAEAQRNGRIHFHFVTDHFIPFGYLNKLWNGIQKNHGYLENHFKKFGNYMPPSVQIEKIQDKKAIRRYMRKYMTKGKNPREKKIVRKEISEKKKEHKIEMNFWKKKKLGKQLKKLEKEMADLKRRKIAGKLWGCSSNLLIGSYSIETDKLGMDLREELQTRKKLVPSNGEESPYFLCFEMNESLFEYIDSMPDFLRQGFILHYERLFPDSICPVQIFNSKKMYSYPKAA